MRSTRRFFRWATGVSRPRSRPPNPMAATGGGPAPTPGVRAPSLPSAAGHPAAAGGGRAPGDGVLPWSLIDGGMKDTFFRGELDKGFREEWTLPPKRAAENAKL